MDKKDFQSQYQTEWWYETSKRIKARDKNTCQMCGCNDKPLSVHHLYYDKGSIRVPDTALVTLCEDCHKLQKRCRTLSQYIIESLREEMTDFEIYNALSNLSKKHITKFVSNVSNIELSQVYPCDCDGFDENYFTNLSKWRKSVHSDKLVNEALEQYYISDKSEFYDKEKIKTWFFDFFGEDIEKYISEHEEEAKEARRIADEYKDWPF